MQADMTKLEVKVETFTRLINGMPYGVRICFLYQDRGPEIFEKEGFPTEPMALQWGKGMVAEFAKSFPGAEIMEEPCRK